VVKAGDPQLKFKILIYDKYLECIKNANDVNVILLNRLVNDWCKKYSFIEKAFDYEGNPYIEADDLGVGVYNVFDKWINNKKQFKNISHFFYTLKKSLKNKLIDEYRRCPNGLRIPKWRYEIRNILETMITEKENTMGRELNTAECEEIMSKIMTGRRKKIKDYYKEFEKFFYLKDTIPVSAMSKPDNDGNVIDADFEDLRRLKPEEKCLRNEEIRVIRDTVREILKSENSQCLNDILTVEYRDSHIDLYCLSEYKNSVIIENYRKTRVYPFQKDIYLKYHNDSQPDSAGSSASRMLKDFEKKVREKVLPKLSSRRIIKNLPEMPKL